MAENNENKNDMLEALDSIETVKVGDVVKGEVLAIDDDRQAVHLGKQSGSSLGRERSIGPLVARCGGLESPANIL